MRLRIGRGTAWVAAFSMALALVSGCRDDECESGSDHCEGDKLLRCVLPCAEWGCSLEWEVTQCTHCVETREVGLFCALSDQPVPGCDQRSEYCDGDRRGHCRLGYLVGEEDCAAKNLVCAERESDALCALSSEPDPSCAANDNPFGMVCDGSTLKSCDQEYLLQATTCPDACVAPDPLALPFCALSAMPDPRCETRDGWCDGSTPVHCTEGFARNDLDCSAWRAPCVEFGSSAYCDIPADEDAGTSAP